MGSAHGLESSIAHVHLQMSFVQFFFSFGFFYRLFLYFLVVFFFFFLGAHPFLACAI